MSLVFRSWKCKYLLPFNRRNWAFDDFATLFIEKVESGRMAISHFKILWRQSFDLVKSPGTKIELVKSTNKIQIYYKIFCSPQNKLIVATFQLTPMNRILKSYKWKLMYRVKEKLFEQKLSTFCMLSHLWSESNQNLLHPAQKRY